MFRDVVDQLKCWFGAHNWVPNRAKDWQPEGYQRLFPNEDKQPEPIPACYIVDKCTRCGCERRIYSSVDTAERIGVPLEWNRSPDTDT